MSVNASNSTETPIMVILSTANVGSRGTFYDSYLDSKRLQAKNRLIGCVNPQDSTKRAISE